MSRMNSSGGGDISVTLISYSPLPGSSAILDTSVTPVTNAAYTTLLAAAASQIQQIEIINKTEIPMILALGAPGSEVDYIYIGSDGLARQGFPITAGTRISVKSTSGTANSGLIMLNAFG